MGTLLGGLAAGAAAVYYLDPISGGRRRALVRDWAVHLRHKARRLLSLKTRDLANRAIGMVARTRRRLFWTSEIPADDVLVERVRARIGRVVSHPHGVEVHASKGNVTLQGIVPAREQQRMLKTVFRVPGVVSVESRMAARLAQRGAAG